MLLASNHALLTLRKEQVSRQGDARCPRWQVAIGVARPVVSAMAAWAGAWTAAKGLSEKTGDGQGWLEIQRVDWIEVLSLLLRAMAWILADTSLFSWRPTPSNVNYSRAESSLSDLCNQAMKLSPATTNGAGLWVLIDFCQDPDLNWAGSGMRPPWTPDVVPLVRL